MDFAQFQRSLGQSGPPDGMPPLLHSLWWDGRGDWKRAHLIAQDERGKDAAWVHAYLHRKEGDEGNAAYWYRQAGKTISAASPSAESLDQEWMEIVTALLLAIGA